MAHIWTRSEGEWAAVPLQGSPLLLSADPDRPVARLEGPPQPDPGGAVVTASATEGWVVVGNRDGTWINGRPLRTGLRVLRERDEIRLGPSRFFFSDEAEARVEPLPEGPTSCARCRQPIQAGAPAVRCPSCGVWHHQSEDHPCWTYAERCSLCSRATPLDAGFRWSPAEL